MPARKLFNVRSPGKNNPAFPFGDVCNVPQRDIGTHSPRGVALRFALTIEHATTTILGMMSQTVGKYATKKNGPRRTRRKTANAKWKPHMILLSRVFEQIEGHCCFLGCSCKTGCSVCPDNVPAATGFSIACCGERGMTTTVCTDDNTALDSVMSCLRPLVYAGQC
jgi:hypothetical protein